MKKIITIIFIPLICFVMFFGCVNNKVPTIPEETGEVLYLSINSNDFNEVEGKEYLISSTLEENERLKYIEDVLRVLNEEFFIINSEQEKKAFKNKLEAVILMYKAGNEKGAIEKLEKDVIPKINNLFSNSAEARVIEVYLSYQKILIEHPEIPSDTTFMTPLSKEGSDIVKILAISEAFKNLLDFLGHLIQPNKTCPNGFAHAGKGGLTYTTTITTEDGTTEIKCNVPECGCYDPTQPCAGF
ncbi:MAG: hypothetical protein PHV06_07620 [bacterium]|nr:hypothetical protein [bacterium]